MQSAFLGIFSYENWFDLPPTRYSGKGLIPTHLIIYMGVSAVKWGMLAKLDPAFPTELLFLISVWSCFIHAESVKFPNMPGSRVADEEYFLELTGVW